MWGRQAGGSERVWAARRMESADRKVSGVVYALANGGSGIEEEKPDAGKGEMRQVGENRRKAGKKRIAKKQGEGEEDAKKSGEIGEMGRKSAIIKTQTPYTWVRPTPH